MPLTNLPWKFGFMFIFIIRIMLNLMELILYGINIIEYQYILQMIQYMLDVMHYGIEIMNLDILNILSKVLLHINGIY